MPLPSMLSVPLSPPSPDTRLELEMEEEGEVAEWMESRVVVQLCLHDNETGQSEY